jgi:hypothetical protein
MAWCLIEHTDNFYFYIHIDTEVPGENGQTGTNARERTVFSDV